MFANGLGDGGSISGRVKPKTLKKKKKKWYLMPPCLTFSIIRYGSGVKWSNIGNGVPPSLHLGVVANDEGAFGSLSTMVANFTSNLYMHTYINTHFFSAAHKYLNRHNVFLIS